MPFGQGTWKSLLGPFQNTSKSTTPLTKALSAAGSRWVEQALNLSSGTEVWDRVVAVDTVIHKCNVTRIKHTDILREMNARLSLLPPQLPPPLQNKEFVCRGHDYERLEAFQQRMLNEFPHAIAMQHVNQPDQTIYQAEAQCILAFREKVSSSVLPSSKFVEISGLELCDSAAP